MLTCVFVFSITAWGTSWRWGRTMVTVGFMFRDGRWLKSNRDNFSILGSGSGGREQCWTKLSLGWFGSGLGIFSVAFCSNKVTSQRTYIVKYSLNLPVLKSFSLYERANLIGFILEEISQSELNLQLTGYITINRITKLKTDSIWFLTWRRPWILCSAKVVFTYFSSQCAPQAHWVHKFMHHFISECDFGAGHVAFPITECYTGAIQK